MAPEPTIPDLESGVRRALAGGSPDPEGAVEGYLNGELGHLGPGERVAMVEALARRFAGTEMAGASSPNLDGQSAARFVSLLLGKDVPAPDTGDAAERFAQALNTVFDTLNQLIGVINSAFFGRSPELETIRQVIGAQMEEGEREASLKDYLEQIRTAFLIAHNAFQESSRRVAGEILSELDPDACEVAVTSGLKIGPMRKAEAFEVYRQRHLACRQWLDSGGFTGKLLRELEKSCRQASEIQGRSKP